MMFIPDTYKKRRDELRKLLPGGIVLFPGNTEVPFNYPANTYTYRQDSTFIYYCGLQEPGLAAVMDIDDGSECLFGDDSTMDDIIWMGRQPLMNDKAAAVKIDQTQPCSALADVLQKAQQQGRTIHFLPPYRAETKIRLWELLGIQPAQQREKASVALIKAVVKMRTLKEPQEIEQIEAAIDTSRRMHTYIMKHVRAGMVERELSGAIEGIALANGGPVSFPVILSINGQILHNHSHDNTMHDGQLLITDAGAETSMGYAGDITRTTPVSDRFDARQKAIYNTVLRANLQAIEMSRPGILYRDVHLASARVIADGLKDVGIMRGNMDDAVAQGAHALFFPHGLGHAMGLDVHDMENLGENYVGYNDTISRSTQFGLASLRFGRKLEPGFVLTDEPGIYFIPALMDQWEAEKKFTEFINYEVLKDYRTFGGIRIEDDIWITENGCRVLGPPIPKTVEEIEGMREDLK
jgi:Xaa-Pro aminopeptidase